MEILYSSKFKREYKKLPTKVKDKAEEREKIFRKNPFDKRLSSHKLHGRLSYYMAFSIGYDYRIIFDFKNGNKSIARFYSVGKHDNLY